jgi:hypothetical protein
MPPNFPSSSPEILMTDQISKPDANPILLAVLDFICCLPIGHFMIGQQKKAIIFFVVTLILSFFGVGMIIPLVAAYDVYLLGQKLKAGESIGINENGLKFLDSVPGFKA